VQRWSPEQIAELAEQLRAEFLADNEANIKAQEQLVEHEFKVAPLATNLDECFDDGERAHSDKNEYTIVENYALDHPDCKMAEIAAYSMFCRTAHFPKRTTSLSKSGLAARLGIDRRTAANTVDRLLGLGLLKDTGKRTVNGAAIYELPHRYRPKPKRKTT
jgi:hypothetical protein